MVKETVEMFVSFSPLPEINHGSKITNENSSLTNNSKSVPVFPLADITPLAVFNTVLWGHE